MVTMDSPSPGTPSGATLRALYTSAKDTSDLDSLSSRVQAMKASRGPPGAATVATSSPSTFLDNAAAVSSVKSDVVRRVANEARSTLASNQPLSGVGSAHKDRRLERQRADKAFAPFDVNRDGLVTRKEFHQALKRVAPNTTDAEAQVVLEAVDPSCGEGGGDLVSYRAFTDVVHELDAASVPTPAKVTQHRPEIAQSAEDRLLSRFSASASRLRQALKRADTDGDGRLNKTQFARSLRQLNVDLDPAQVHQVILKYDVDGNGTVAYDDFVDSIDRSKQGLSVADGPRSRSPQSLAKDVVDKMFKNSSVEMMAKHFRGLNTGKDGTLDKSTVEQGLRLQGATLSRRDMDDLLDSAQSDGKDGRVNYHKLVSLMANADRPENTLPAASRTEHPSTTTDAGSPNHMWWASTTTPRSESQHIVDDRIVRALSGRHTKQRASIHQQKSGVLEMSSVPVGQRERTEMEKNEAIVRDKIARAVDAKLDQVKTMFEHRGHGEARGLSLVAFKEGLNDCGVLLGNDDFARLTGETDPHRTGQITFEKVASVVVRRGMRSDTGDAEMPARNGTSVNGVERRENGGFVKRGGANFLNTTRSAVPAGRPSTWQQGLLYADETCAGSSPRGTLNPTFYSSMQSDASLEYMPENRRRSNSPTGGTRPNASLGFGRATGNVLVADFMRGSLPEEAPEAHLYSQTGHPVASSGKRLGHEPASVSAKENGERAKTLLEGVEAVDGVPGEERRTPGKRTRVHLHGPDAAGVRTVDSRGLRRRMPSGGGAYKGSDGVAESLGKYGVGQRLENNGSLRKARPSGKKAFVESRRDHLSGSHRGARQARSVPQTPPRRNGTPTRKYSDGGRVMQRSSLGRGGASTRAPPPAPSSGKKAYRILTPVKPPPPPRPST